MEYLTQALDLHRRADDRNNEVEALRVIAATHRDAGRHGVALEVAEQAVTLARDAADLRFETLALNTLATVYARLGDFPPAVDRHRQARRTARDVGGRIGANHQAPQQRPAGHAATPRAPAPGQRSRPACRKRAAGRQAAGRVEARGSAP